MGAWQGKKLKKDDKFVRLRTQFVGKRKQLDDGGEKEKFFEPENSLVKIYGLHRETRTDEERNCLYLWTQTTGSEGAFGGLPIM